MSTYSRLWTDQRVLALWSVWHKLHGVAKFYLYPRYSQRWYIITNTKTGRHAVSKFSRPLVMKIVVEDRAATLRQSSRSCRESEEESWWDQKILTETTPGMEAYHDFVECSYASNSISRIPCADLWSSTLCRNTPITRVTPFKDVDHATHCVFSWNTQSLQAFHLSKQSSQQTFISSYDTDHNTSSLFEQLLTPNYHITRIISSIT